MVTPVVPMTIAHEAERATERSDHQHAEES
jgi:hypothetical protein